MTNAQIAAPQRTPVSAADRPSNINPKPTRSQSAGKTDRQLVTRKNALTREKTTPRAKPLPPTPKKPEENAIVSFGKIHKPREKPHFCRARTLPARKKKTGRRVGQAKRRPTNDSFRTLAARSATPPEKLQGDFDRENTAFSIELRNAVLRDPKKTRETLMVSSGKIRGWPKFEPVSDTSHLVLDTAERIPESNWPPRDCRTLDWG
jgi:hypothetical protein